MNRRFPLKKLYKSSIRKPIARTTTRERKYHATLHASIRAAGSSKLLNEIDEIASQKPELLSMAISLSTETRDKARYHRNTLHIWLFSKSTQMPAIADA